MKKIFFLFILFVITINLLRIISCKKSGTNPTEKDYVMPDSNLVFDSKSDSVHDIQGLFTLKCGSFDGCHSPINPVRELDLTSDCNLILNHQLEDGRQLVLLGNGESSILYLILLPDPSMSIGERMPQGGPYLNDNQMNAVKLWIDDACPCDP
jgi:hypothetical protein